MDLAYLLHSWRSCCNPGSSWKLRCRGMDAARRHETLGLHMTEQKRRHEMELGPAHPPFTYKTVKA